MKWRHHPRIDRPWALLVIVIFIVMGVAMPGIVMGVGGCRRSGPASASQDPFDVYLSTAFPVADGFDFPVGDEDARGEYRDSAGHVYQGWYVATRFGEEYSLGIHTGEDWNGRGGGDTDFGQPVRAIGAGRVVLASPLEDPWGKVIILEHLSYENQEKRLTRSLYAHLSRIDVHAGEVVGRRQVIGAIGRDPGERYPAHLHLEIRTDAELPPTYSPSSNGRDLAWVKAHYLDPSGFIKARRHLSDPRTEASLVVVDKARHRMRLYDHGKPSGEYEVAFGQADGCKEREGDLKTPCGMYFVVDKNTGPFGGDYGAYFGGYWIKLNYPNAYDARRSAASGEIAAGAAALISAAWVERKPTAQNTPLGGGVGFHSWISEWDARQGTQLSWGCVVIHPRDAATVYRRMGLGTMVVIF